MEFALLLWLFLAALTNAAAALNSTYHPPAPGMGGRKGKQSPTGTNIHYKVVTWDDCSLVPGVPTSTITELYCGKCMHTTAYKTVWSEWCPTATAAPYMTPVTYQITETCTGMATPVWSSSPGYVPAGYTAEMSTCTACPGQPSGE